MYQTAFKNNILPLKDKFFRFALRIVPNVNEAEDIVQDAMLKIWNKREEWAGIENMEAYCYRVVKNLIWDRIQSKDYQNETYEVQLHDGLEAQNPYTRMVEDEQVHLIHRLIEKLPAAQKATMQLRDIEGLPYAEIAEILNISESQVKNNLFRGRKKIKQLFEKIDNYERP
ncbi:MAG: RNA polymerase sigma factor [Candidatus Azobacteroides sp.]|nr:RNA polymerase sigma factor [Candidatus Azobacteroides sp.]